MRSTKKISLTVKLTDDDESKQELNKCRRQHIKQSDGQNRSRIIIWEKKKKKQNQSFKENNSKK